MPATLIFKKDQEPMKAEMLGDAIRELLGIECSIVVGEELVPTAKFDKDHKEFVSERIFIAISDLEDDEGMPIASIDISPRLDRDEALQKFVDEIVKQEPSLDQVMNHNNVDIMVTFDEFPAGVEAGSVVTYAAASVVEGGVLVLEGMEDEESTVWFPDAEGFADMVFGEAEEE